MEAAALCVEPTAEASALDGVWSDLPYDALLAILSQLSQRDVGALMCCSRGFAALARDAQLWRWLFPAHFPAAKLSPSCQAEWRYTYLRQLHQHSADMTCYYTKQDFEEAVLGYPLELTVNPYKGHIDYIYSSCDLLSEHAYQQNGVRRTLWGETFTHWLPLYLSAEHFERALPALQRSMARVVAMQRLAGRGRGGFSMARAAFDPLIVLDVIPPLMNTMVVLIADKGIHASDKALEAYCQLQRLLQALVWRFPTLRREVDRRVREFCETEAGRSKERCRSVGNLLPLLGVCSHFSWPKISAALAQESMDRSVLWVCRKHPSYARRHAGTIDSAAPADRTYLAGCFEAVIVGRRLLMFHAMFLRRVARPPGTTPGGLARQADLLYGAPPRWLAELVRQEVARILEVDSWQGYYAALGLACPGPKELELSLCTATSNSLRRGYHKPNTNFSRIQRSGVSTILHRGQSFAIEKGVNDVRLSLGAASGGILCGACLLYEGHRCREVVHYNARRSQCGAITHSGDTTLRGGGSEHVISCRLAGLPASVTRLFFTLCACGATDLSGFTAPTVCFADTRTKQPVCEYTLSDARAANSVVMCVMMRDATTGAWKAEALGHHVRERCCSNYGVVKRVIPRLL